MAKSTIPPSPAPAAALASSNADALDTLCGQLHQIATTLAIAYMQLDPEGSDKEAYPQHTEAGDLVTVARLAAEHIAEQLQNLARVARAQS